MVPSVLLRYHEDLDKILKFIVSKIDEKKKYFNYRDLRLHVLPTVDESRIKYYIDYLISQQIVDTDWDTFGDEEVAAIKAKEQTRIFIESGGYTEMYNDLEISKNMKLKEAIIKDLTIEQLKGSIFQLRYWWLLLLISGLIGFIAGNFELIINLFKSN